MAKLSNYNKKRNFNDTGEPKGGAIAKKGTAKKLRFVVQRHHASRLHYDFRLEFQGVLKSWAVPKGPSMYPKDKRLAMEVEDHPIDYASFEGIIPKGNYGAGVVHIFDSGYYDFLEAKDEGEFLKQWEKGSIKIKLHGHILKGEFALVRMKSDQENAWLLIKHQDKYAANTPYDIEQTLPEEVKQAGKDFKKGKLVVEPSRAPRKPMLAKLVDKLPSGSEWLYEKKYDGFRIIALVDQEKTTLYSRNGKKLNDLFPSLVQELTQIDKQVCLDGELVIENQKGQSQFQLIAAGEPIPSSYTLIYYIFDMLALDRQDLSTYALVDRKELLALLFKRLNKPHFIALVEELHMTAMLAQQKATEKNWEGIIAKDKQSPYREGKRSEAWVKFKLKQSQEAIICGYTKPQGSRSSFGALVLGVREGDELIYIGNCGTGFDTKKLQEIHKLLQELKTQKKPFTTQDKVAKEKEVTWVKPLLVCEVYFSEWTTDRHLRHPVFKSLRQDKDPQEIEPEDMQAVLALDTSVKIGSHLVKLTNLDKVYWPKENYLKGQMVAYYEEMADHILPFLKNKPISLNRFPNGIQKDSFFQKDVDPEKIPAWIKTVPVHAESTNQTIDYIVCNNKATLLYIANLGSIEINPWLSSYQKPDYPEFGVLDLDPNGADFQQVIVVAKCAKEKLDKMEVPAFLKTSGSTGLHIYVPVNKQYTFVQVRDFFQLLAQWVHEQLPETTSVVRDPKKRKGLIYLDFLQNRRAQTVVAPYSLRPKPGATASAPLAWSELKPGLSIADFTIKTLLKRVKTGIDPWADIWDKKANLKKAITKF